MGWKLEQFKNHPRRDEIAALVAAEKRARTTSPAVPTVAAQRRPGKITFTVPGTPVAKPRMTQRDKWQKRPAVLRYRDYCDRIRASAQPMPALPDAIVIDAFLPIPHSWSKKKTAESLGRPHRQKSDADNILKAVCDALFEDDSCLWDKHIRKFWCQAGQERTQISVLYLDDITTVH
jgi:Holliday junction resolvase RusA-like endonuclease